MTVLAEPKKSRSDFDEWDHRISDEHGSHYGQPDCRHATGLRNSRGHSGGKTWSTNCKVNLWPTPPILERYKRKQSKHSEEGAPHRYRLNVEVEHTHK